MNPPAPDCPTVLIVDDRSDSRFLIRHSLEAGHYEVLEAASGLEALRILESVHPDVILLDVCMPGMSGYEVCRVLKAGPATCKIPLILVSALSDRAALARGFAAGAVDYLAKPVRPEELCARVTVHVELNRARRELEESHARLAALNQEKDMMFGMAAHDLRGPLSVITGFAESMLDQPGEIGAARSALQAIVREARQMEDFLGTLLDLEALERGGTGLKSRTLNLGVEARQAVERAGPAATRKKLTLRYEASVGPSRALGDENAVRRILDNLVSNAVKFTPPEGRISVRLDERDGEVQCVVRDSGPGLTPKDMERVFTRFARLSARPTGGEKSTGLGLAICRALAEGMGGRAWCGNNEEGGAYFAFSLPAVAMGAGWSAIPWGAAAGKPASISPFPHLLAGRALA